jgi:hypothetical protein
VTFYKVGWQVNAQTRCRIASNLAETGSVKGAAKSISKFVTSLHRRLAATPALAPLGADALAILHGIKRTEGTDLVFPASAGESSYQVSRRTGPS